MREVITIERRDFVNTKRFKYLALYGYSFPDVARDMNNISSMALNVESSNKKNTYITTEYRPAANPAGRVFDEGCGLQGMSREVRAWLMPRKTVDLDIECAAPNMLKQVLNKHGVQTPSLEYFLQNQEECMDSIYHDKDVRSGIMFGLRTEDLPTWAKNLQTELFKSVESIRSYYPDLYKLACRADKKERKVAADAMSKKRKRGEEEVKVPKKNVKGKFLANLYQQYEMEYLTKLDELGVGAGHWDDRVVLMHDGLAFLPLGEFGESDCEALSKRMRRKEIGTHGVRLDMRLKMKPLESDLMIDVDKIPKKIIIKNHTRDAAAVLLDIVKGRAFCSMNSAWALNREGIWVENPEQVKDALAGIACDTDILLKTAEGPKPYSCKLEKAEQIGKRAMKILPIDAEFNYKVVMDGVGKLQFENGYYDFDERRFVKGGRSTAVSMVRRKFPKRDEADIKSVNEVILDPIFKANEQGRGVALRTLARALAGRHTDKVTVFFVGERNAGKSVILRLCTSAVGFPIVGMTTSQHFMLSRQKAEASRSSMWIMDAQLSRLCFVSEANTAADERTGKRPKMDGEEIKRTQSPKDGVLARNLYNNLARQVWSAATFFFLVNDIPDVEPAEALVGHSVYVELKTIFATEQEMRADPFNTRLQLKNPLVDDMAMEKRYGDAFLHILLDNYQDVPVEITDEMADSVSANIGATGPELIQKVFVFTGLESDTVTSDEVRDILSSDCGNMSVNKFSRFHEDILKKLHRTSKIKTIPPKFKTRPAVSDGGPRPHLFHGITIKKADNDYYFTA